MIQSSLDGRPANRAVLPLIAASLALLLSGIFLLSI